MTDPYRLPCGHPRLWALRLPDGTVECCECKARAQSVQLVTGYEMITLPPSLYGIPDPEPPYTFPLTDEDMERVWRDAGHDGEPMEGGP